MEELLSLKWNNHCSAFLKILRTIRNKEKYMDITLACSGKFYGAHKLVLSMCSDYFEEMFQQSNDKNLMVVLKDINPADLELLLDYMYLGEVSVKQADLSSLLKAAECLQIKGLAVADDEPIKTASKKSTPLVSNKKRKIQQTSDYDDSTSSYSSIKARGYNKCKAYNITEGNEEALEEQKTDSPPIQIKEEGIPYEPETVCLDIFKEEEYVAENVSSLPSHSDVESEQILESSAIEPVHEENNIFTSSSSSFQGETSEWPDEDSSLNYPTSSEINPLDTRDQGQGVDHHKGFICPYCSKSFVYRSWLDQHVRIHTGERPFTCPICPYSSKLKRGLQSHVFLRHNTSI